MKVFHPSNLNPQTIEQLNQLISEHGLLIEKANVVFPNSTEVRSILIDTKGKITEACHPEFSHNTPILDARGLTIFPGFIDIHTHPRDGAQSHKETWSSLGRAAVAGGVTSVFGMPNTEPLTDTLKKLLARYQFASLSPANHAEYIGTRGDNIDELLDPETQRLAAGIKEYLNETTGSYMISQKTAGQIALQLSPRVNKLITTIHAEGSTLEQTGLALLEMGQQVHVAHISLAREVDFVRHMQARGFPISAEVTPHHLLIGIEDVQKKVRADLCELCVMKPPLSPATDLPELFRGLRDGTIQSIATDHAPHTLEEKQAAIREGKSVFGIPGIQEMAPLMLSELPKQNFSLSQISKLLSSNAASRFHINQRGTIKFANFADLTFVNLQKNYRLGDLAHPFFSQCGWSAYQDWPVSAEIVATMVNGRFAFGNGEHSQKIHSQRLEFNR